MSPSREVVHASYPLLDDVTASNGLGDLLTRARREGGGALMRGEVSVALLDLNDRAPVALWDGANDSPGPSLHGLRGFGRLRPSFLVIRAPTHGAMPGHGACKAKVHAT